jgi:membrane protease YdiL (CAAX protease family)
MHFRFDVITLFATGVIYALLYLKTKQYLAYFIYKNFPHNYDIRPLT